MHRPWPCRAVHRRGRRTGTWVCTERSYVDKGDRNGSFGRTQGGIQEAAENRVLRDLLEGGPVFAAFGRYLASRIDILPFSLCEKLATIPNRLPPSPAEAVVGVFVREIGVTPDRAFRRFDIAPFDSRFYWQSHRAELAGVDVEVRIIHPELPQWTRQAENISSIELVFEACGVRKSDFREVLAEFDNQLALSRSFKTDLIAFGLLEQDALTFDSLAATRVRQHLTTPHVLVCERSPRHLQPSSTPCPEQGRQICFAWLRQALNGLSYPVEPLPDNVGFTREGRVLFTTGPFATLAQEMKNNLLKYLVAVAAQDADQAYSNFASLVFIERSSHQELRRQFQQMCPSRDGFGSAESEQGRQPFTGEVLIHWRLAKRVASMSSELNAFFRGFLNVSRSARMLAPGRDSLLEALHDLRLLLMVDEFKTMIRPDEMTGMLERYATAALRLPEQVDCALTSLAIKDFREARSPSAGGRRASPERYVLAVSLLFAFAAVILLMHKVEEAARSPGVESVLAIGVAALGLICLRLGSKL